ncbi:MAG TPA: hypothetical protein ENK09_13350 [Nitrospirae bacterium]|nr:hypothetical protein [Nitrospirota bacterium]
MSKADVHKKKGFIADAMLGRLARWMRFLGYDVLYCRDIDDRELVRTARAEDRILLTRDRELTKRFSVSHLLIRSEDVREQLKEVLSAFPGDRSERRCMQCNTPIRDIRKREVEGLVPEYVYLHNSRFQQCPRCGRIYWEGSHTENISRLLRELGGDLEMD